MRRDVRCRACGVVLGRVGFWRRLFRRHPQSCAAVDPIREDGCIERYRTGRGLRRP